MLAGLDLNPNFSSLVALAFTSYWGRYGRCGASSKGRGVRSSLVIPRGVVASGSSLDL